MRFPRQEYCRGLPSPSPGDLPNPEIKPGSPALKADSLPSGPRMGMRVTAPPDLAAPAQDAAVKPTRRSLMSVNKGPLKRPGKAQAKNRDLVQGV